MALEIPGMFQFLIGSVKRKTGRLIAYTENEFQFLIGSVKSYLGIRAVQFWLKFQFLIGSVKRLTTQKMAEIATGFNSL